MATNFVGVAALYADSQRDPELTTSILDAHTTGVTGAQSNIRLNRRHHQK